MGRQKSLFPGALIGPKSLFCFTPIACNFESCAAHRRSLLLQQAASVHTRRRAHSSTRVVWCRALTESSMSITTGQPRNRRHIITRQVVEKEAALWPGNRKQSTKKTCPSGTATMATRHTTASNTVVGWSLYEYVGWLLLLLPQRVALL